jgi:hypothetical protein
MSIIEDAIDQEVQARVAVLLAERIAELEAQKASTNQAVEAAIESHLVNIRQAVATAIVSLQELSL